ncbi:hypothetical protein PSAB6_450131 [Paraburkholderia sabiae]|uniref:hypothetical protein n=1 Tax=Paraburkholderia sabiae TaxID=273251 RepID=UPI001CB47498|nr:hypothetical protein [Paraburkholderia sabiae]CAG9225684.1 hypothetical protein PSAB6_450131 [Paraburkholderia sabiae]
MSASMPYKWVFIAVGFLTVPVLSLLAGIVISFSSSGWAGCVAAALCAAMFAGVSQYMRLAHGQSLILTAGMDRTLRVSLEPASLQPQDAASLTTQLAETVNIAARMRAKTLTFDSPLLSNARLSNLLVARVLKLAADQRVQLEVAMFDAVEVGKVRQKRLARYSERYNRLRPRRIEFGPNGRYMSRRVEVRFVG